MLFLFFFGGEFIFKSCTLADMHRTYARVTNMCLCHLMKALQFKYVLIFTSWVNGVVGYLDHYVKALGSFIVYYLCCIGYLKLDKHVIGCSWGVVVVARR